MLLYTGVFLNHCAAAHESSVCQPFLSHTTFFLRFKNPMAPLTKNVIKKKLSLFSLIKSENIVS